MSGTERISTRINFDFPVVSGPYALDWRVKTNRSISLKRRGDWWGRIKKYNQHKFNFDYLVFKSIEDRTKALEVLKKGRFRCVSHLHGADLGAADRIFRRCRRTGWCGRIFTTGKPIGFQGLALNMRRPVFQDARVRQALALLLNRELMNEKLMFNQYFLLNSYYPDLYPKNMNPGFSGDEVRSRTRRGRY